jgi:hypothetical protein
MDTFLSILKFFIQYLPDSGGFGLGFGQAVTQVMSMGWQLGFVINWPVIFECFSAIVGFELSMLVLKLVIIIANLFRGSGA